MFPSLPVNQRITSIKGYSQWRQRMHDSSSYLLNNSKPDLALSFRDYQCMPAMVRNSSCAALQKTYVNQELNNLAALHPRIPLLSFGKLTQQLYDVHWGSDTRAKKYFPQDESRDGADCTHFCYMPGLIEAQIHFINEAIAYTRSLL